jgi:alkylation response protein AidB-like acyl-CoA dehydrogenase
MARCKPLTARAPLAVAMPPTTITTPDDPALADLCRELAARAPHLDETGAWPAEQLRLCGEYGVYEWFAAPQWGGQAWDGESVIRGYLALAAACLTTTFIITQREGACRRLESSDNEPLKRELLPALTRGDLFATVGISHLTTSRRHVQRPVLRATPSARDFQLDGYSPWVTGAAHADRVLLAATVMDGEQPTPRQLLAMVPTDLAGVRAEPPARLVGLSASWTGQITLERARIEERWLVDGPIENVMARGSGAGTGGLQTSTLALGLSRAAIKFLTVEAQTRPELLVPTDALAADLNQEEAFLWNAARGTPICSNDVLRSNANSLVLRATQAALAAAKGAGYVQGHPAGRWCREALFFLVWSCPQPVLAANLCQLAGILE